MTMSSKTPNIVMMKSRRCQPFLQYIFHVIAVMFTNVSRTYSTQNVFERMAIILSSSSEELVRMKHSWMAFAVMKMVTNFSHCRHFRTRKIKRRTGCIDSGFSSRHSSLAASIPAFRASSHLR